MGDIVRVEIQETIIPVDVTIGGETTTVDITVSPGVATGGGGGGGTWGSITGTLSSQTDLQAALDAKGAGTVTSVAASTSVSGLSWTGSPITSSGTLALSGTVSAVTEGAVTAHQAALSITESQISDLGTYLTGITGESVGSLSDVTITTVASGEVLAWDGVSAWINRTLAEAGIAAASHTHAASDITSGALAHERGGLESDVSAYSGLVKISGGTTSQIADNSSNWDTAFGWGDHSTQGYLTESGAVTDSNNIAFLGASDNVYANEDVLRVAMAFGVGANPDAATIYVGSSTGDGTDGAFSVYDATNARPIIYNGRQIVGEVAGDIAFSMTNAGAGNFDLTVGGDIAADNLSGTNTGDETASGILTKIKTVDGASSGLDADLLDGSHASAFQTAITFGAGIETALGVNVGSAGAPVLFDGVAGTPSSIVLTNATGTASSLTAGTCTTIPNLSGDVTSSGNTTTISAGAVDLAMLSATGTPSSSTYLRGDNTWATIAGGGDLIAANNLSELTATASTARANLGLTIGTHVQAYNAGLAYLAGLAFTNEATFKAAVNLEAGTDFLAPNGNGGSLTSLNATQLTTGTIPAARVGSDHIDAITEIASAIKAGTGSKLVTNGNDASIPIYTEKHSASHTISAAECYGGVHYVTSAATITLPAAAAGMSVTIITVGAIAVSVDPNASDLIMLDGVALDDGDKITNLSTTGDIAVLTYYDATGWYAATNGWTDGGA